VTAPRPVAVTGVGMVTPLGNDVESTWNAILSGESGVREIAGFDASGFPTRIAAEVKDLRTEETIEDR
jgi:3-oxoacyl-[acyl-carrier-protein] synthase II